MSDSQAADNYVSTTLADVPILQVAVEARIAYLAGLAAERERAAQVAESEEVRLAHGGRATAREIAAAIRRGPQPEDAK